MGFFRFRRSIKIAPGIKINFNKKSTSLTLGRRGVHTTINKLGVRNTIGLPGSGLSYTSYKKSLITILRTWQEYHILKSVLIVVII